MNLREQTFAEEIARNHRKNGRHCISCKEELTGWKRRYCNRQCKQQHNKSVV